MPIVRDPLPDPTDIVMAGASIGDDMGTPIPFMTAAQMMQPMSLQSPLLVNAGQGLSMAGNVTWNYCCMLDENVLVPPSMFNSGEPAPLDYVNPRGTFENPIPIQPQNLQNNFICSSTGTQIPLQNVMQMGQHPVGIEGQYAYMTTPMQAMLTDSVWPNSIQTTTARFSILGITKDSTGAVLGSCRVVCFETARIEIGEGESEVGEVISDGSGNYTIPVPLNTAYQLTAYKAGSPDVAGITVNNVVPSQIG
jgi:hypothetical protein